jgi:hypothetical protein
VLELTPAVEQSPYLSFHEAVFQILAWLQEEEHAGRDQPWSAVEARLRVAFEALLAVDHPLFAWYLGQAKSRLRTLWHWQQDPESSGARRRTRVPAEVRLAGMALTFHIDQVVETQQGLIARRDKLGRVYKSHLDDPMLALYRLALAGGDDSLRVELRYPAIGEIIEVGPQKDQRLLAQLEAALQGIQQAEFPPQPADSRFWRTCASCPYLWNCPIGERA